MQQRWRKLPPLQVPLVWYVSNLEAWYSWLLKDCHRRHSTHTLLEDSCEIMPRPLCIFWAHLLIVACSKELASFLMILQRTVQPSHKVSLSKLSLAMLQCRANLRIFKKIIFLLHLAKWHRHYWAISGIFDRAFSGLLLQWGKNWIKLFSWCKGQRI